MELEVYRKDGETAGRKIEVSDKIFASEPNDHAIYLAVKVQRTNMRQGNAATKTRSMVSGGGKKPWKQKGRGTARSGTNRSPIWAGGGTAHGPQPHEFNSKLPKKVKRLARISVLSSKAKNSTLKVLEDFQLEAAKTKEIASVLKDFSLENKRTLMLVPEYDPKLILASRNIKNFSIAIVTDASTYDLLNCKALLVMEGAIKKLEGNLGS